MPTLTVTAKGQVTLRQDLLRHLGVAPGDRIAVYKLPNGRIEVTAAPQILPITKLFGALHHPATPPLSPADIDHIISEGWAGRR